MADRDSPCKQLLLDPDYAGITVVTLRGPATSNGTHFPPIALLFGSVSAKIRYNCFARSLAAIINRALGIPALNYFGDFGDLVPEPLCTIVLWMVENTSLVLGAPMKTANSLVDTRNLTS